MNALWDTSLSRAHESFGLKTISNNNEHNEIDKSKLARQYAMIGNKHANEKKYEEAVRMFSEAIKLDEDYRFYGNRSLCYVESGQFEAALRDAETAIKLQIDFSKGYFRKGVALLKLKQYKDAETAFNTVLRFNQDCPEAKRMITEAKTGQLMERGMGIKYEQAAAAIQQYQSVDLALEHLLLNRVQNIKVLDEVFTSEDEEELVSNSKSTTPASSGNGSSGSSGDTPPPRPGSNSSNNTYSSAVKMPTIVVKPCVALKKPSVPIDPICDPSNPSHCITVWVGNVNQSVTQSMLLQQFQKYGPIQSVSVMLDKHCAFINFRDWRHAGAAMKAMQGFELAGQKLLVKYPDRVVGNNVIKKSPITVVATQQPTLQPQQQQTNTNPADSERPHNPLPNGECYFYRTTGCTYGNSCRYKHIPQNKGIDRKAWMVK